MDIISPGLICVLIAALSNCVGGLIATWSKSPSPRLLRNYMAFGAGFILTAALTEMVPESIESASYAPILILGGYVLVLFCENALVSHIHIEDPLHREEMARSFVGTTALIGMTIHAILDGSMIASGFAIGNQFGILLFLLAIVHKLPEGLTIASIQLSAGHTRKRAMGSAALLAASTLAGAAVIAVFGGLVPIALPIATGAILYVAASDLIPVLGERKSVGTVAIIGLGCAMFLLAHAMLDAVGVE